MLKIKLMGNQSNNDECEYCNEIFESKYVK